MNNLLSPLNTEAIQIRLPLWSEPKNLEEAETAILSLSNSCHENFYSLGKHFIWIKAKMNHGQWIKWAKGFIKLFKRTTIWKLMDYARRCDAANALIGYEEGKSSDPEHLLLSPPLEGTYRCLTIDPPWPIQKIERYERPNQGKHIDYPIMTLEEITALPIKDLAAEDGSHIYLWTTQKFLPAAFKLFEAWDVNYECLLTWVKKVGMTPYSWMYNSEHILFGRRGNLPLLKMGVKLAFFAETNGHSKKPDYFYEMVAEVSPGPRYAMYETKERPGFKIYGYDHTRALEDRQNVG